MNKNLFKVLSFWGAGISLFLCFVGIAAGITLIANEHGGKGAIVIVFGVLLGASAVLIYRNFEKKDLADKPGVKISDLRKKKK